MAGGVGIEGAEGVWGVGCGGAWFLRVAGEDWFPGWVVVVEWTWLGGEWLRV